MCLFWLFHALKASSRLWAHRSFFLAVTHLSSHDSLGTSLSPFFTNGIFYPYLSLFSSHSDEPSWLWNRCLSWGAHSLLNVWLEASFQATFRVERFFSGLDEVVDQLRFPRPRYTFYGEHSGILRIRSTLIRANAISKHPFGATTGPLTPCIVGIGRIGPSLETNIIVLESQNQAIS